MFEEGVMSKKDEIFRLKDVDTLETKYQRGGETFHVTYLTESRRQETSQD